MKTLLKQSNVNQVMHGHHTSFRVLSAWFHQRHLAQVSPSSSGSQGGLCVPVVGGRPAPPLHPEGLEQMGVPQICSPSLSRGGWGYRLRGGGTGCRTAQKGRSSRLSHPSLVPSALMTGRAGAQARGTGWTLRTRHP